LFRATFSDFFRIFHAWRCFNCGAMYDRTITHNRRDTNVPHAAPIKVQRRWVRRAPISVSQ
jgi:hypothetical protein